MAVYVPTGMHGNTETDKHYIIISMKYMYKVFMRSQYY